MPSKNTLMPLGGNVSDQFVVRGWFFAPSLRIAEYTKEVVIYHN